MSSQPESITNASLVLDDVLLHAGMVDIDKSLFFMLALFLLFAILLYVLVMKPLIAAQEQRHAGTGGAREDASALELQIASQRQAYEARLTTAKRDAVKVREDLKDEASATAAAQIATARAAAETRHADELKALEAAGQKARVELNAQADKLADAVVTKLLGSA